MLYLDKKTVVEINQRVTYFYNQPHVVIAEANLDYVLEQVAHYGENISGDEERIFKKAAFLLYHLAFDAHVFADGNKRTALLSASAFLSLNSYHLILGTDEIQVRQAQIMKETAEGKKSISFLANWLREVSKKS